MRYFKDMFGETWSEKMMEVDKEHLISLERCIDDWRAIYWAEEIHNRKGKPIC